MDQHLAGCSSCCEVFAESVQFMLDEEEEALAEKSGVVLTEVAGEASPKPSPARLTFVRRPAFRLAAGLAAAAALVLAIHQIWRSRTERPRPALLAELAEAMGTRRFVEPRLTGGFQHGRLIVLRSGDAPKGLDAHTPAVLAAVAHIRERAERDPSAEALGALGVTYLVSGDIGAAIKSLEQAAAQEPSSARLQSDLAAAYFVRATRLDEPADLPKALEAAETAITLKDPPAEAYFNLALALEKLHLVDPARKAWEDYLKRDSTSGWADEARRHIAELPQERQSSVEEDRARVRAALQEGPAAVNRLADESPSLLRDYFQNELLGAWADAYLEGRPDNVARLRTEAQVLGDALLRTTGDALPLDTARALIPPSKPPPSADPLVAQALGYRALREGKRLHSLQQRSCEPFREAHRSLEAGGSPYAAWTRERVIFTCLFPTRSKPALAELAQIGTFAEARGYALLLGRVRWVEGLFLGHRGDLTTSLKRYAQARVTFRAVRDVESESWTTMCFGETLHALGERRRAWVARSASLRLLGDVRDPRRRHGIFEEAALACLDQHLSRSALEFQSAVVQGAARWSDAVAMSDALVRRAEILHILGLEDLAVTDVAAARRATRGIADPSFTKRLQAEADAVEGTILAEKEPERATLLLERALSYFQSASPFRVPSLSLLLGRAQAGSGHDNEAEEQLEAGIRALEAQRLLGEVAPQGSPFDQAGSLFDAMVDLQVDRRRDPDRALLFIERGRARQLADSLEGPGPKHIAPPTVPTLPLPLEPSALQRELPDDVALVYYVSRQDRLLSWALTHAESRFAERPLPADEVRRLVAVYEGAIERRADVSVVRQSSARLYDELIRPLAPVLRTQRALIFIPDDALESVAFAGLWDRQASRYLVEDHLVGLVPSGTAFVKASAAATKARHDPAPTALVVGNPRVNRDLGGDLPSLPGAEAEAIDIAPLYEHSELLTGRAATKTEFMRRMQKNRIVHFAGHAVSGEAPWATRILFAPDPSTGDSGALYLHELDGTWFPRTRVVVLAACRTAAGRVSRFEGGLNLARPFLAAGVPSVVASLWDIDDTVSRAFFVQFHRALLAEGDPLLALRETQIALMRDTNPLLAHPASWAGFVSMGGLDVRQQARALQHGAEHRPL